MGGQPAARGRTSWLLEAGASGRLEARAAEQPSEQPVHPRIHRVGIWARFLPRLAQRLAQRPDGAVRGHGGSAERVVAKSPCRWLASAGNGGQRVRPQRPLDDVPSRHWPRCGSPGVVHGVCATRCATKLEEGWSRLATCAPPPKSGPARAWRPAGRPGREGRSCGTRERDVRRRGGHRPSQRHGLLAGCRARERVAFPVLWWAPSRRNGNRWAKPFALGHGSYCLRRPGDGEAAISRRMPRV